jgi:hypothetical protein
MRWAFSPPAVPPTWEERLGIPADFQGLAEACVAIKVTANANLNGSATRGTAIGDT